MSKARRHGSEGERQILEKWKQLDPSAHRDRSKAKDHDGDKADKDITTQLPFSIQVKSGKAPSPYKALNEASHYAQHDDRGDVPVGVLNFQRDVRQDPEDGRKALQMAVMRFDDFVELAEAMKAEGIY